MNALERTLGAEPDRAPWWTMDPMSVSLWRRPVVLLRNTWFALTRARPERRYEQRILERMARGELIDTLGVEIRNEARTKALSERWLAELVKLGLRPEHLCVEYGCGSLWCATPAIHYLQTGGFIGLDATDRFYEFGRQRLGKVMTEKEVGLAVISRQSLREVAALKPDFVYSHKVLHHVPRYGLARYVRKVTSLLNERTTLVLENTPQLSSDGRLRGRRYNAEDIQRYLPRNWNCRQEVFGLVITHRSKSLA